MTQVPFATDAPQHDRRKKKDRRAGDLSEIRSGVLNRLLLQPINKASAPKKNLETLPGVLLFKRIASVRCRAVLLLLA